MQKILLLITLTILNLFNYCDRYVLSSVLEDIKRELSLTDGQLGRLASTFMLTYFISGPLFGYLGDKYSRKWLIFLGAMVWSLATFFTGFAYSLGALIVFRLLIGLGESSFSTISPGIIADSFSPKNRNNAMTLLFVSLPLGAALGYLAGGLFSAQGVWRHAFYYTGIPGIIFGIVILFIKFPQVNKMEDFENQASTSAPLHYKSFSIYDIFSLFKSKNYCYAIIGYIAYTFAMGAYSYWAPTFLTRVHQVPTASAAKFFGASLLITGLLGTFLGGLLATKLQEKYKYGYALLLAVSSFLSIPFVIGIFTFSSLLHVQICIVIALVFLFASTAPINTVIIECAPSHLKSSSIAMSIFLIHLFGDFYSPELVGIVSDHLNNLKLSLLIITPIAFLVTTVFWTLLFLKIKTIKLKT